MIEIHFTGLVLRDPTRTLALLQKRSPEKSFLPNCYSAIGGKTDPGESVEDCIQRESGEECPQIDWSKLTEVRQRLTLHDTSYVGKHHIMHWFTGILHEPLTDFSSTEGNHEPCRVRRYSLYLGATGRRRYALSSKPAPY